MAPSNFRFTDEDKEQIEYIRKRLGVSKADAVRTAVRVYFAILTNPRKA